MVFGSKGGYLVENYGFLSKFDMIFTIYCIIRFTICIFNSQISVFAARSTDRQSNDTIVSIHC